jgi:hypothetical protein
MSLRGVFITAGCAVSIAGPAQAEELATIASRSIDLGGISGVAYYTVEPSGYHVVATLAHSESAMPVRFEAVLAPGQTLKLSTPGTANVAPAVIEISRDGDRLLVRDATVMN